YELLDLYPSSKCPLLTPTNMNTSDLCAALCGIQCSVTGECSTACLFTVFLKTFRTRDRSLGSRETSSSVAALVRLIRFALPFPVSLAISRDRPRRQILSQSHPSRLIGLRTRCSCSELGSRHSVGVPNSSLYSSGWP